MTHHATVAHANYAGRTLYQTLFQKLFQVPRRIFPRLLYLLLKAFLTTGLEVRAYGGHGKHGRPRHWVKGRRTVAKAWLRGNGNSNRSFGAFKTWFHARE
jgi:hypothetical protein